MKIFNSKKIVLSFVLLSIVAYVFLGYFVPRENFSELLFYYTTAFLSFYFIYKSNSTNESQLFKVGILFRFVLLFCMPFWSQDFYRFIWDGRIIVLGLSPYSSLPNDIVNTIEINQAKELFKGMGSLSASHYSNYPPVNQLFFGLVAMLASKSIVASTFILKIIILLADIGTYKFGKKILNHLQLSSKNIFLYFLNPLVIIELTGNLHFEGVMLFFFVLGIYLFIEKKWILSAVLIGLSISTKLLPLLLLPFFYQILGFKKSLLFYSIVILLNLILFLPFISPTLIHNYSETIALWFVNFEFNASFYYIFRTIGYWVKGYNTIATIGKIIPILTILLVLFYSLIRKNKVERQLLTNSLLFLTVYFLLSTTVHPWYLINLVVLTLFTRYRFAIVWSYFVVLSYFAYSQSPFKENNYLVLIEYAFVIGCLLYEAYLNKNKNLIL